MADATERLVIVTGAASGIGAATVAHLRQEGWRVVGFDLDTLALAEAVTKFASDDGVSFDAVDVTDEPAVTSAVTHIEQSRGAIEGVVNCAGIARDIPTLDHPIDLFRTIMDVNVTGTFIVGRAVARHMSERKRGAIVNIASISGLRGSKGRAAYGASKGAVITMTQVMANDLAPHGIRVNAVAPGPVETPMIKALHTDEDRGLYLRYVPMNRYADPSEIASVIAFLLDGTKSSFVTAEIIAVDGGYRGAGIIERD
ncbi:MAG: SDR family oxidoreductase [Pseudomonadota bacterium]